MKHLIALVALLLFSNLLFASTEVWKLGGRFYEFSLDEKTGILISKNCVGKNCEALKFLKKVSFKNTKPADFVGGKNPGAVLCHKSISGKVIILRDLNGNDNSFCHFTDNSFVSSSSVESEASKNDKN